MFRRETGRMISGACKGSGCRILYAGIQPGIRLDIQVEALIGGGRRFTSATKPEMIHPYRLNYHSLISQITRGRNFEPDWDRLTWTNVLVQTYDMRINYTGAIRYKISPSAIQLCPF